MMRLMPLDEPSASPMVVRGTWRHIGHGAASIEWEQGKPGRHITIKVRDKTTVALSVDGDEDIAFARKD